MTMKSNIPGTVTLNGTAPLTPEQIVEQLRLLQQHIPEYGPLPTAAAVSLRSAARVHDELLRNAADTVGASPFVAGAIGRDADTLRNDRNDVGRWSAVEKELKVMYEGVASANLGRRYRLGLTALQTYSIARQLVRQPEHSHLLPHVEAMRRVVRLGRRRRAPEPVEPVIQPVPPPVTK